ncbi:hypothetical protein R6Q59_016253 [Mikania micrantha]
MDPAVQIIDSDQSRGSKMVIELLKGIHFVSSVEAISLGVQDGVHPWILYDIISNAAGNSWIFKNYIPNLLHGNQIRDNSLHTSVQDLVTYLNSISTLHSSVF